MISKTTLLPDYIGIVQNTSLDFYNKSTNLLEFIGSYLGQLEENIKFNRSLVTTNVLSSYGVLYNQLNTTNFTVQNYTINQQGNVVPQGEITFDNSFKLYFVEKYLSLSKQYRTIVNSYIENNEYFTNFSDDIGYITDIDSIMDNNVNPYFDIFNQQYLLQTNAPGTINSKITRDNLALLKTFTYYADPLMKQNLVGLQTGEVNNNTAKTSHGTNLITDILYYERAVANQQAFLNQIQIVLGNISDFIYFFKGLNPNDKDPDRYAFFFKYLITNMENLEVEVDVLKNNLNHLALSSKEVLGA